jgi:hypothetical protein
MAFELIYWMIPSKSTREDGDHDDHRDGHNNHVDKEEEDDDHDDDIVRPGERFIGLPLTTQKHPPQPYTRDDPAVKEFGKIHESKRLRREIGGSPFDPRLPLYIVVDPPAL